MATLARTPGARALSALRPSTSPLPAVARVPRAAPTTRFAPPAAVSQSSGDDSPAAATPIAGASTLAEVAEHDKLIDRLLGADGMAQVCEERWRAWLSRLTPPDQLFQPLSLVISSMRSPLFQLSSLVAENLMSFDQKFWIRVAARSDTATPADKAALSSLASAVMGLVDAAVQRTDTQLSSAGAALQRILAAGADEAGEWHLPLAPDRIASMRGALDAEASAAGEGALDEEALLSNAFAWMRKAADDGQDGLVRLLQRALQIYAARALGTCAPGAGAGGEDEAALALAAIAEAEEDGWEACLRGVAGLSAVGFEAAIRRRMESVVLGLPSGSYAQRVQAEYLKEVERAGSAALGGGRGGGE